MKFTFKGKDSQSAVNSESILKLQNYYCVVEELSEEACAAIKGGAGRRRRQTPAQLAAANYYETAGFWGG